MIKNVKKPKTLSKTKIIVYSQPTCAECAMVKEYLDKKGVHYEDINIRKNKAALEEMKTRYGIHITPVVVIGEQVMVGFNVPKLEKLLSSILMTA